MIDYGLVFSNLPCISDEKPHYIVDGTLEIASEKLLYIEPGVRVMFLEDAGILIREGAYFHANGTTENHKNYTGDPKIILKGGEAQKGFWKGIRFESDHPDNILNNVVLTDAGKPWSDVNRGAILVHKNSSFSLVNSQIKNNSFGVNLFPSTTINEFSNNTFENNLNFIIRLPIDQVGKIDKESTLKTSGDEYIRVHSEETLSTDITIKNHRYPIYLFENIMNINSDVEIEHGVKILFKNEAGLKVNKKGRIYADGTSSNKIILSRYVPPAYSLGALPWRGIYFSSDNKKENYLNHTIISSGGSDHWNKVEETANIVLDNSSKLTLTNSEIKNSSGWGIWINNTSAEFSEKNNTYSNNADGNVGSIND